MPTDKEIEEAIEIADTIKSNIWESPKKPAAELGRLLVIIASAYLSEKAKNSKLEENNLFYVTEYRNLWGDLHNVIETTQKTVDKYKAIVEADTKALNQVREAVANSEYWWMDCPDRGGIDCELVDKVLALRENKE